MILVSHIVFLTVFNPFYFSCIKFRNFRVDYTRLKDLFSRIFENVVSEEVLRVTCAGHVINCSNKKI